MSKEGQQAQVPAQQSPVPSKPNPPPRKNKFIPDWRHFFTGGTAGAVSRTITNPLERLKILRQLRLPEYTNLGFFKVMFRFAKKEGFKGFFKGNGANVVRVFPFTAFQFYFYELFKLVFFPQGEKNVYKVKLICGGLSGVCTSTLTYPLDFIRTLLSIQTSTYKTDVMGDKPGMFTGLYRVFKTNGILGWYKGWVMSMVGVVPYLALQLSAFDYLATKFLPSKQSKWFDVANLSIGAAAGGIGAGTTYPLDVIRRKMQLNGIDPNQPQYSSIMDCLRKMHKADGFKAFYRGFMASEVKILPAAALMFMINERLKRALHLI